MKKIHLIAAARPNFMKVAPIYRALRAFPEIEALIVHTGQHYDQNMAGTFMQQLGLPTPHVSLGVGSGSHAEQTGRTMIEYEKVCLAGRPDLVVVVGDVNATVACALVASKLSIPVAHLEAGLRSRDRGMPEELNRLVTDQLSDLLWTTSADADQNLLAENIPSEKIELVGNTMIDSLITQFDQIRADSILPQLKVEPKSYIPVTIHRPSNVDSCAALKPLIEVLGRVSKHARLIFPIHPRTLSRLKEFGLYDAVAENISIQITDPLPYNSFLRLVMDAKAVITDSGGIQEETTFLGVPCLTMRENTERPITVTHGTNRLTTIGTLERDLLEVLHRPARQQAPIPCWDGKTGERVAASIVRFLNLAEQATCAAA